MRSLSKRVEKIEQRNHHKDRPAPYIAIVSYEGTVNVSHVNEDDFQLPSEEALDKWIEDNNLNEGDYLKIIIVNERNTAGPPPKEI